LPGFAVSLLATWAMRRIAPRFGLVDHPAARKVHAVPTPLGGGIGIWLGIVLPLLAVELVAATAPAGLPGELSDLLVGAAARRGQLWSLVAAGTLLSCVGLLDDLKPQSWKPRLALQFLLAAGLVWGAGIKATLFVGWPWLGEAATVLWLLVLMNAFNFLDNMDALSGGIALIASLLFAVMMLGFTPQPHWLVGGFLLLLAGSIGGFLVHNAPPARIFMGDTGSHLLGMMLGAMTVVGTFYEYDRTPPHVALAPLCVLAVPLYDFTSVILIRLCQGRSPFQPDKSHFSHRLAELGMSKPLAVATIHLATVMTGLGGLLLYVVPTGVGAALVVAHVACALAVVAILETTARRRAAG
jgi:UDP-GlcNAc:undecaprenyl-phosphate GlcNAc-1-phosphate transferase